MPTAREHRRTRAEKPPIDLRWPSYGEPTDAPIVPLPPLPPQPATKPPSRRGMLAASIATLAAGAAAVTVARAAPPAAGTDAELMNLCAEFLAADALLRRLDGGECSLDEDASGEAVNRWFGAMIDIAAVTATTEVGRKTKGRVAYASLRNAAHSTSPIRHALLVSALADLLEGQLAPALPLEPPPNPDAELLELCRDFMEQDVTVKSWNAGRVTEDVGEAAHDQWWGCMEEMEDITPATIAGLRAKAACTHCMLELACVSDGTADELARSFLAQLATWRTGA